MSFFTRLFPIKPHEWPSALAFFSLQAVLSFGAAMARSVGFTLMVGNLGKDFLPYAFIFVDLMVMLGSFAYVQVSKKSSGCYLAYVFLSVMAIFAVFSWVMIQLGQDWIYGVFFIGFFAIHILSLIHLGNFTASYYTSVEAKRVMAFIYTGLPVGGILGGLALITLLEWFAPEHLILVLIFTSVMGIYLVQRITRTLQPIVFNRRQMTEKKSTVVQAIGQTVTTIFSQPLLRQMALASLLFVLAMRLLEFQYQGLIYPAAYPDLSERSAFFGRYEIIANLCWLFFQLFFSSRILLSLGVGASNLVHPILIALASGGLFFSFTFMFGIMAQFINQELRSAIRSPANSLLFNAIPRPQWPSIQAFLNGLVIPLATVLASALLLSMQGVLAVEELQFYLPMMSFSLAILGIIVALRQWKHYNQGIVDLLSEKVKHQSSNKGLEAELRQYLQQDDVRQVGIALELVRSLKNPSFIPLVGKRLIKSRSIEVKRDCAKTLAALPKADASLTYLLRGLSLESDPEILSLLLMQLRHFRDPTVSLSARRFLQHPYPEVFAAACYCLLEQGEQLDKANITKKIKVRLQLQSLQQRFHSIEVLGYLADPDLDGQLQPFLDSENAWLNMAAYRSWVLIHQDYLEDFKHNFVAILSKKKTPSRISREHELMALKALLSCSPLDNWLLVVPYLASNDVQLVQASTDLCLRYKKSSDAVLRQLLLNENESLRLRQQLLFQLNMALNSSERLVLIKQAEWSLARYLLTRLDQMTLLQQQTLEGKTSCVGVLTLLLKLSQEQSEQFLSNSLIVMAYLSGKDEKFAQRLLLGLTSSSRNILGNALEALTNCQEKVISERLFQVFDDDLNTPDEIKAVLLKGFESKVSDVKVMTFDSEFAQEVWTYWQGKS